MHILSFVAIFIQVYLLSTSLKIVHGLYSSTSAVKTLTASNFQSLVKNGQDIWLVEFFAPWCGHCKAFAAEYEKVARAMKGIVTVGAVEDESVMPSEGVQGFPTVKLYFGREDGSKVLEYTGERYTRTAEAVVKFIARELAGLVERRLKGTSSKQQQKKSKTSSQSSTAGVVELTDTNFDKLVMANETTAWFVKFYAPWCGHCKAMIGDWARLPSGLKGKVNIGKVDATTNSALAQRFGIKGYPTLKMFPAGKKSVGSAVPYQGERNYDALLEFASQFVTTLLDAEQLLNNDQFVSSCEKKLCIISFLPHILDSGASGRRKYLDELTRTVKAASTMPMSFFWLQGGDNFDLEESLQLQFGYPAVVAVHLEKKKFSVHRGDFSFTSLRSFLTGSMAGRQPLAELPTPLIPFSSTSAWDGKDTPITTAKDDGDEL